MDMNYSIPKAIANIDSIIMNLDHSDVDVRRNAAAWAQYAALGHLPKDKTALLLETVSKKLTAKVNGRIMLIEPDEYVRQRCANALEMASSTGKNIAPHLPTLKWSRDNDPHEWVRDMAGDALKYHKEQLDGTNDLPLPASWTTRPQAPAQSYIRELAPSPKESSGTASDLPLPKAWTTRPNMPGAHTRELARDRKAAG